MMRQITVIFSLFFFISSMYGQQLTHRQGELLVRFADNSEVKQSCQQASRSTGSSLRPVRQVSKPLNIWLCRFDFTEVSEDNMLHTVQSLNNVRVAQYNHLVSLREPIPNDPGFENQWQWLNMGFGGTNDADVDAELAWDVTTGGVTGNGDSIVVAVIDDGTEIDHPDLENNIWINRNEVPDNGIDDDNNGYVDDYYGWNIEDSLDNVGGGAHGVSVSGMIGAEGNNGIGITGINWNTKIMNITGYSLDEAKVIESYTYALDQRTLYEETNGQKGAYVVATNSSWGLDGGQPEDAPLWCAFYDTLGVHGILNCGATANRDWNIDEVGDLPTGCSSEFLLSVTATDINDQRTFSAYGTETIDLGAPGDEVYTTRANQEYGTSSGTSFASPLTAGVIALLYSVDCPNINDLLQDDPIQAARLIRDAIFFTVDQTPQLRSELKYGGRINAHKAVQFLRSQCGNCTTPYGITFSHIIDTSAEIRWNQLRQSDEVTIQYRQTNDTAWEEQLVEGSSPAILNGLKACRSYEIRLRAACQDTTSTFSFPRELMTDGCCEYPQVLEQVSSDYGTGKVSWESVLAAEKYLYRYRKEPTDPWIVEETMDTSTFIPALDPCNRYQFQIATVCDTGQTDFRSLDMNVPHCQSCSQLSFCGATAQNTSDEWIESVQFDGQSYTSGPNLGYLNQTSDVRFAFIPGQSGELRVNVGYAQDTFSEFHRIYLDANQNGSFEEEEILAKQDSAIRGDFSSEYTIPENALFGISRMRVIMKFRGFDQELPSACDTFNFGEVEDFCVRIRQPDCQAIDTVLARDIMMESFEVYWESPDTVIAYNIRYRDTMGGEWNYESALDTSLMISGLEKCTDYEVQVRSVCPFDTSDYLGSTIIKTECETAIAAPDEALSQLEVFPNPSKDYVHLRMNAAASMDIQVRTFTSNGHLIDQSKRSVPYGSSSFRATDLKNESDGLYFIVIDTPYQRYTRKVIKS